MEVRVAKPSGFCFGVQRAVDIVDKQVEMGGREPIYTYGPIIHNEEVVRALEKKGVRAVEDDELESIDKGTMIIRSHGVSKETEKNMEKMGFNIVDATCPFVKKIHRTVSEAGSAGKPVLIVGSGKHPEVQGIIGWCSSPPFVLETVEDIEKIPFKKDEEICLVCQTTFNLNKFKEIVDNIRKKGYYINVVNTICNATEERQSAARELAALADCMIVIGGTHSSNSRKLYEICKMECENTYFIQTLDDLHLELPKSVRLVGITAGASTPNNIIEEVQNYVRNEF